VVLEVALEPRQWVVPMTAKGRAAGAPSPARHRKRAPPGKKAQTPTPSRLDQYNSCVEDTPGSYTAAALSFLLLGYMKLAEGFRLPGSSAFTSIDRRAPWLPFANTKAGMAVREVAGGVTKRAGLLGTVGTVVGTFATSYALTTITRCAIGAR